MFECNQNKNDTEKITKKDNLQCTQVISEHLCHSTVERGEQGREKHKKNTSVDSVDHMYISF